MNRQEEFQRTIGFGETAIGHLRANETPAYPRNYELWYTYAAGFNAELNRAVNEILRAAGVLTCDETNRIYDTFISPLRFGDRIDQIGGKLSTELRGVSEALTGARDHARTYGQTLEGASTSLAGAEQTHDSLRGIVEGLLAETRRMEAANAELEQRLEDSARQIDELHITLEAIRNESLTDPLTSLANRKCFDTTMERALAEAASTGKPFSLLMSDIDHFKKFNDTFGHQTGDQVLRLVASCVKQNVKGQDLASRYGGEEFAVVLPRTLLDQALRVADHIREAVMSKELVKRSTNERLGRVTISLGCATWRPGDTGSTLVERADAALYKAKRMGRNRVCSERDLDLADSSSAA